MRKLSKLPVESIDFKTFCKGGSPEYVAAKQKLDNLYQQQQKNSLLNRRNLTAYSLYINPLALFDVHFMLAAGAVVLVAVLEKKLADNGIIGPAAIISGILKIGFPLVAFGSILILISKLGVFL
ncbi:hypothetical protein [Neobacillus sp. FSL H8-0543]|uniref:hypothetical protein n=1 Tax=Neobacillus sp. FSL H8-0543 TaxID=2954672 RepID=UPI003157F5DE